MKEWIVYCLNSFLKNCCWGKLCHIFLHVSDLSIILPPRFILASQNDLKRGFAIVMAELFVNKDSFHSWPPLHPPRKEKYPTDFPSLSWRKKCSLSLSEPEQGNDGPEPIIAFPSYLGGRKVLWAHCCWPKLCAGWMGLSPRMEITCHPMWAWFFLLSSLWLLLFGLHEPVSPGPCF